MAGDWIKVEMATIDKPEVLEMADLLGTSADDVLGKLIRVWAWFDLQTTNGNAGSVTGNALKRFIDRLVASQGFASCMEKVGWLSDGGMPNFDRHNGESAKKRALTNKRVKRSRNADSVTDALPEKRREEKREREAHSPSKSTRLPKDWKLTTEQIEWAIGAHPGWNAEEVLRVGEIFRDYWVGAPGKQGLKQDWDATWRNWVRREIPRREPASGDKFAGAI